MKIIGIGIINFMLSIIHFLKINNRNLHTLASASILYIKKTATKKNRRDVK
jgi:hypothetical protein